MLISLIGTMYIINDFHYSTSKSHYKIEHIEAALALGILPRDFS